MILKYAELSDPALFVCPWHRGEGGPCGQSLAEASVIVILPVKKFAPVSALIDKADSGERVVFWCPKCEGAIYISPVEQGFAVGIPPI